MNRVVQCSFVALIPVFLAILPAQEPAKIDANQKLFNEIGYTSLATRLRGAVPTGENVWIVQVEPSESGPGKPPQFRPDIKELSISDRSGFKMTVSGDPDGPLSGHATMVAQYLFGKNSVAKGVSRVDIVNAETDFVAKWLGFPKGHPRTGSDFPKISSHSYVDSTPRPEMVRRLDHLIAETGHIAVVAVGKNTAGDPVEPIFGSNYNAITVGLSNGICGNGLTREGDDGPGRTKPDIVVPVGVTSIATSIAAAAAALLVQAAGSDPDASKPITIKAAMMAGASKTISNPDPTAGWKNDRLPESPLHPKYGAGQLDLNTSHRILTSVRRKPGNEQGGSSIDGWGVETLEAKSKPHTYIFDVPDERQTTSVSAVLTWNRRMVDPDFTPVVPQFELTFGPVDANGEFEKVVEQSRSRQDNVEMIWNTTALNPGQYGLRVSNNGEHGSEYAIAWHVVTKSTPGVVRDRPRTQNPDVSNWIYYAIGAGIICVVLMLWRMRHFFTYMTARERRRRKKKYR